METEIESLKRIVNIENETHIDRYLNNQPNTSLLFGLSLKAIFGYASVIIVIIVIIIIIICCYCCDSDDQHSYNRRHHGSDTSNFS